MKKYYAGYNGYGINVVNCWTIHTFTARAERDAWVAEVNAKYDQPRAEVMTAKQAVKYGGRNTDNYVAH